MPVIELKDPSTGTSAKILPELGFNCFEFLAQVDDVSASVIDAAPDFAEGKQSPSGHGIPILFPYPNRIRGGRFSWKGKDYYLPPEKVAYNKDNAIHGFCLDRAWRVAEQSGNSVLGEFQLSRDAPDRRELWPADFLLQVRYTVYETALLADVRVTNPDTVPLPWGFGTHPYFRVSLEKNSDPARCIIEAPATEIWELIDCLPTGTKHPLPPEIDLRRGVYFNLLKVDDVLSGLPQEPDEICSTIWDESAGLEVEQVTGPVFQELVAYTPPGRAAVCLEPYTCVTDAINLCRERDDTGWQVLPPGETWESRIIIQAGRILV